jgi:hypothetical protein
MDLSTWIIVIAFILFIGLFIYVSINRRKIPYLTFKKLSDVLIFIGMSPLLLFGLLSLIFLNTLSFALLVHFSNISQNINLLHLVIAALSILAPLIYVVRTKDASNFWQKTSTLMKILYLIILVPTFALTRQILLLSFISGNYISNTMGINPLLITFLFLAIDFLYWGNIQKTKFMKNEPLIWKLVGFNFSEAILIILVGLTILVLSSYLITV